MRQHKITVNVYVISFQIVTERTKLIGLRAVNNEAVHKYFDWTFIFFIKLRKRPKTMHRIVNWMKATAPGELKNNVMTFINNVCKGGCILLYELLLSCLHWMIESWDIIPGQNTNKPIFHIKKDGNAYKRASGKENWCARNRFLKLFILNEKSFNFYSNLLK